MTCREAEPLLNAYLDGELDLAASLDIEQHMSGCEACQVNYTKLELLREEIVSADLSYRPGSALEEKVKKLNRPARPFWRVNLWRGAPLLAVLSAAALFFFTVPSLRKAGGTSESRALLDSHLRSLLPDHLVDIASSGRHTVKPWFQGKTSFSPPVPDLAEKGFSLIGGRLEVIHGLPAAALVYQRGEHVINLYVSQSSGSQARMSEEEMDGYHLLQWTDKGLSYSVISDLNIAELHLFAGQFRTP